MRKSAYDLQKRLILLMQNQIKFQLCEIILVECSTELFHYASISRMAPRKSAPISTRNPAVAGVGSNVLVVTDLEDYPRSIISVI